MTTKARNKKPEERCYKINFTFLPENHRFCKLVSGALGISISNFLNDIIIEYRQNHPDIEEKSFEVIKAIDAAAKPQDPDSKATGSANKKETE